MYCRKTRSARCAVYQNGFARLELSAIHHAVVGGFKVAGKVAGLVKGEVVWHRVHRFHGRNRIRGKAAIALIVARRAWAQNEGAEFAAAKAMQMNNNLRITLPHRADDSIIDKALRR